VAECKSGRGRAGERTEQFWPKPYKVKCQGHFGKLLSLLALLRGNFFTAANFFLTISPLDIFFICHYSFWGCGKLRGKLPTKRGRNLRRSAEYQPGNAYIISVQLDQESREKLRRLCQESGFSMSRMIRTLVMGARVHQSHTIKENSSPKAD